MSSSPNTLSTLLGALSSLADDTRLRLLRLLEQQELGVGELGQILQLPQPTVSRHLKTLAEAGFVSSRREGTSNLYRMTLTELPEATRELWQTARDQLTGWPELEQDNRRLTQLLTEKATSSQAFFAGAAAEWDGLRSELYGQSFTTAALLSLIPPSATIADLACGTGSAAAALAPYLPEGQVFAIDNSPEMLAAARSRCASLPNVTVKEGDVTSLPLENHSCHGALLLLALTYLPTPDLALREAARILRPGGTLAIIDLLPHARDDFRRKLNQLHPGFPPEQIKTWLTAAGLTPGQVTPLPSPPEVKGPGLFLATGRK